jgi:Outer membrane protein beta-barrel domain
MNRTLSSALLSGAATLVFAISAMAQDDHKWNFNAGGGYTPVAGLTGNHLDGGGNLSVGAGYNFSSSLGIVGEFGYNWLGVNPATLSSLGVPNGTGRVWSLTANPIVRVPLGHRLGVYFIGGGGLYQRRLEFTSPTTETVFNPIFGAVSVSADQVVGSSTSTAGGLNGGGGFTFSLGESGARLYVESRYNHAFTNGPGTSYVPVTIGIRW